MNLDTNQKVLFLTDIENGLEPILQEATKIRPENMVTIQSYGPVISNLFGDIMRSVVLAIYQANVKEIFVVGIKDKGITSVNSLTQVDSIKDEILKLDDSIQNSMADFLDDTVNEWLTGKENVSENIEKCVDIIRNHPLVPSDVRVRGLIINNKNGKYSKAEVVTN
ncbi:carbonic anhydrase [Aquibacillus halophilus]|uniref:Carbonic anhydrase n=1 Tax=Aquibacillus halophilus TaxID=930132 RepID=A0A6A8DDE1_9BACI|nr:carbonic anhydrase [Aquibacillus halophilus]MRH43594.1 carbonic anhydrase [Aquibacillus halophilus]